MSTAAFVRGSAHATQESVHSAQFRKASLKIAKEIRSSVGSEEASRMLRGDYSWRGRSMDLADAFRGNSTGFVFKAQKWMLKNLLASQKCDIVVGIVIVLNTIMVGWEQQLRNSEKVSESDPRLVVFFWLEHLFLVIYLLELLLRFFCLGFRCLGDHWMKLDCFLVLSGMLCSWLLEPLFTADGDRMVTALRIVRLVRLARTLRLLAKFRVLLMIVRGLFASAEPIFYTIVLLILILYVLSCIGMELLTNNPLVDRDPEFARLIHLYFPSLTSTMLTLLQFVCLDNIGEIFKPIVEKQGYLVLYFAAVLLIGPIVLMNLVTAVIVNGAVEQAEMDRVADVLERSEREKEVVKDLRSIFAQLDTDGSGKVSLEEIQAITSADKRKLNRLAKISDVEAIFKALDVDKSGELTIDEFCDGIWQVAISKVPLEMQRMEKQVSEMHRHLLRLQTGSMWTVVTEMHASILSMSMEITQLKSQQSGDEALGGPSLRGIQFRQPSPVWVPRSQVSQVSTSLPRKLDTSQLLPKVQEAEGEIANVEMLHLPDHLERDSVNSSWSMFGDVGRQPAAGVVCAELPREISPFSSHEEQLTEQLAVPQTSPHEGWSSGGSGMEPVMEVPSEDGEGTEPNWDIKEPESKHSGRCATCGQVLTLQGTGHDSLARCCTCSGRPTSGNRLPTGSPCRVPQGAAAFAIERMAVPPSVQDPGGLALEDKLADSSVPRWGTQVLATLGDLVEMTSWHAQLLDHLRQESGENGSGQATIALDTGTKTLAPLPEPPEDIDGTELRGISDLDGDRSAVREPHETAKPQLMSASGSRPAAAEEPPPRGSSSSMSHRSRRGQRRVAM